MVVTLRFVAFGVKWVEEAESRSLELVRTGVAFSLKLDSVV
jgi:hypothetical protein